MMPSPSANLHAAQQTRTYGVIVGAQHSAPPTGIPGLYDSQNHGPVGATRWVARIVHHATCTAIIAIVLCFMVSGTTHAQRAVTQDEVNAVAERMYCPICENIPLDDCGTATCQAWKEEIRVQLVAGQSADAIVADFVRRYGEQVVGVPQDPTLRALSLVTPWLMIGLALVIGIWTFRRWQGNATQPGTPSVADVPTDTYRSRIEQDVG